MTFESQKYMRQRAMERARRSNEMIDKIMVLLKENNSTSPQELQYVFNRIKYYLDKDKKV